ncbi:hypothetical protein [Streptomyces sp. NPDC001530]|uniref:hypothetical protein n=1 Tax=Streptomyces sp. NPDC001530 TaxID=3364582 RepID=UPI00368839CB
MTAQTNTTATGVSTTVDTLGRPADYWERVRRIVDQAPPLTDDQRARIRAAFHQPAAREAA